MRDVTVMFTIEDEALAQLQARAARDGTSPGKIVRAALADALSGTGRAKLASPPRFALPGALRNLLARDLGAAQNWTDLIARLERRGYALRLAGDRLALTEIKGGDVDIDTTEIGASYGALLRRFAGPFPAHVSQ